MFALYNATCPYCGKPLTENDDLAVCPECGTPHHRSCYKEHGRCANEERHGTEFSWSPPPVEAPPDNGGDGIFCKTCGTLCAPQARFCKHCGAPLAGEADPRYIPPPPPIYLDPPPNTPPEIDPQRMEFYERELKDRSFDGIGVKDWMTYIATSLGYYLYNFKMQDETGRKMSFTWSAMLFPYLYFLYRKVWGAAAIAFGLDILLKLPIAAATYLVPMGYTLGIAASTWATLSTVCSYVGILVNCFWGLFAVYIYRKASARRIKAMQQASVSEQDYQLRLHRAAGPSRVALVCVCVLYFALTTASFLLLILSGASFPLF